MLWSDAGDEPSPESRAAQTLLRRGALLLALLLPLVLFVVAAWPG